MSRNDATPSTAANSRPARLAAGLVLALVGVAAAQVGAGPEGAIAERQIRAHLDFLASDLLEGRDSGFRGGELAAAYLEAQLLARGIAPLGTAHQVRFALAGAASRPRATLRIDGIDRADPLDLQALGSSGVGDLAAPLALPSGDPKDRIVIVPGSGDDDDGAASSAREWFDRGALGVVFVTAKERLEVSRRRDGRRRPAPKSPAEPGAGATLASIRAFAAGHAQVDAEALLSGPVVLVSRMLGPELIAVAERGGSLELEVAREGVDESQNVFAVIPGSDPVLRDEWVAIGAHFDHVGFDEHGNIWNGADDNASGTAALIAIADALASRPAAPRRSILIAFFGAEERGLVGSSVFAKSGLVDLEKVAAYFNLDMIGRNDPASIFGLHSSPELFAAARVAGAAHDLEVTTGAPVYLSMSDSAPFVAADVPTLFFFSGIHEHYHTPLDDPGTVDYAKIARVARTAYDLLLDVADADARPGFEAPPRGEVRERNEQRRRLGFFPDADVADGVGVRAVSGGSLAERAGMKVGDRIVRIGGEAVSDMRTLRRAIETPKDGEEFEIEIVRGEERIVLRAAFEAPPAAPPAN
jgi:hypothetical protein